MTQTKRETRKRTADSVFHELTRSLCPECKRVIDAQIHFKDGRVIMRKRCPDHGWFEALVHPNQQDYLALQVFNKPGTIPLECNPQSRDVPSTAGCAPSTSSTPASR